MYQKLKANSEKITFVLSIIAASLFVPTLFSLIGNTLSEALIISLIEYGLLIAANLVLIFCKNKKSAVTTSLILFFVGLLLINLYNTLTGNYLNYLVTALFYLAIVILYLISLRNPKLKNALYILMLTSTAFFLASCLSGGAISLSILITSVVLFFNIYEKEDNL